MNHIKALIKKELQQYFNSPIAYIIIAVFLVISSWLFFRSFFLIGQATMRSYFGFLPWIMLFLIPAVTMRLWADERKTGTAELLFTWPVREYEPVLGKFLGSALFMAITLALTVTIPISISRVGELDWGIVFASYLGSLLLAGAFLAIGLWVSSLTDNQIIAFIVSVAACFALFIVGEPVVTYTLPSIIAPAAQAVGMGFHFDSIARGVLDSRDLLYYASVIGFFLYLNVQRLKSRTWK